MTEDLRRLAEDTSQGDLARALRDAQEDVLSTEAVDRVRAGLGRVGVTVGVTSSGGTKALTLGVGGFVKLGALLAVLAITAVALRPRVDAPRSPASSVAAIPTRPSAAVPVLAEPAPAPPPEPTEVPQPEPRPLPSVATAARARPALVLPRPATSEEVPKAPSLREGALLLEARRALDVSPARTLELVAAHEREFPVSQLEPERDSIRAEAQRRLAAGK
jgi:hypothetical protein